MHLLVNAVCQFESVPFTLFGMCLHEWLFEVREANIFCFVLFFFIYILCFFLFPGAKDVLYF